MSHYQQEQNSSLDTPTHFQQELEQDDLIEIDPFYIEVSNAWSDEDDNDDDDDRNKEPAKKRQKACLDDNDNVNHQDIQEGGEKDDEEQENKTENKKWEETQREQETVNSSSGGIELFSAGDCIILSSSDSSILERAFNERSRHQSNQLTKEEEDCGSNSDVSGIDLSGINNGMSTSRPNRLPKLSFEAESSVSSFSSFEFPHSSSVYTGRIRSFSNSTDSNEEIDIDNMYVEFEVASDTPDLNPIDDPRSSSSSSSDEMDDNIGLNDSNNLMSDDDVFADEESDDSTSQSDHRIINLDSDSELSGRDRFPCHVCGTMTYAISRYCLRCFKTRRNWLPQRPTTHKGKKKKAKKGKNLKRSFTGTLKYNQQKYDYSTQEATDSDSDSPRKSQSNNINHDDDNSSTSRQMISSPKKSPNKNLNLSSNTQQKSTNASVEFSPIPSSSSFVSNINNTSTATDSVNNTNESNDSSISHSQSSSTSQSYSVPESRLMTISSNSSSSTTIPIMSEREQNLVKESMILNSTPNISSNENLSQQLKSVLNDNPVKVESIERSRHPSSSSSSALCNVCNIRPKAAFVHNKIAHLYSCFKCSSHILKSQGKCPICRQKILRVVKIITV